ncbi:MAG: hypothetical protein MUE44_13820 [Oscillatoriaceae cyanobacterium Prado104]|jgi:hypothetical protein|nr:hypothetical protein [Oscillatoriaceae cyanobacterium Prado104]
MSAAEKPQTIQQKKKKLEFLDRASSPSQRDWLGVVSIASFCCQLTVLFAMFLLYGSISRLASKPVPTLVQLSDGSSFSAAPMDATERSNAAIVRFVSQSLHALLTWDGTLPPYSPEEQINRKRDPGIEIAGGGKIATAAWQACFVLSEDFREEFRRALSKMTPGGVFNGSVKVIFILTDLSEPVKIDGGKWKIRVVSYLNVLNTSDAMSEVVPFNKEVFVRSVPPPNYPLEADGIVKAIHSIRASGLEIYAIRDLNLENLK